jgi:hypothetical protein
VLNYLASRLPYCTVSRRQLVRRAVRVLTRLERLGYVAQQPV